MKTVVIKIGGMTCPACSGGLEKSLNRRDGIEKASVNLMLNNAEIIYDDKKISLSDIDKFVEKAGFRSLGIDDYQLQINNEKHQRPRLIFLGILSIVLLLLSLFGDNIKHYNPIVYAVFQTVCGGLAIYFGFDILRLGFYSVKNRVPDMTTLILLSVGAAFLYSLKTLFYDFLFIKNYNAMFMYESIAMILFFVKLGNAIEDSGKTKSLKALQGLMSITPESAFVIKDGKPIETPIDEIEKNDIIICKQGEKIAADGVVTTGNAFVDESFITGESMPVDKFNGCKVIAGTVCLGGQIEYKVESVGKKSFVSSIVRLAAQAAGQRPEISRFADKIGRFFVYTVIIFAISAALFWFLSGNTIGFSITVFVSVLAAACPCAFGLAAPLATSSSAGSLAKNGMLIKNVAAFEIAGKISDIIFDKTGTLTEGKPEVKVIKNYNSNDSDKIISAVSSIEKKSQHPLANAIVNYANKKNILSNLGVENLTNYNGGGLSAIINNDVYFVGNIQLLKNNGIDVSIVENDVKSFVSSGYSIIAVAINQQVEMLIALGDKLKNNAEKTIQDIKNKNVSVTMLTGDNSGAASAIANCLKINFKADLLPQDKLDFINKLHSDKKIVMMVGDGVNDSPSLLQSDVGISFSNGADIAANSADVVFTSGDIDKIPFLIDLSCKTIKIIKQNIIWAMVYNFIMIGLSAGLFSFLFNYIPMPQISALAMALSSFTIILNSRRVGN